MDFFHCNFKLILDRAQKLTLMARYCGNYKNCRFSIIFTEIMTVTVMPSFMNFYGDEYKEKTFLNISHYE